MKHLLLILFVLLVSQAIAPSPKAYNFIVWDVGQGLWITLLHQNNCYHFDMGGEKLPINKALKLCRDRPNKIFVTHEDSDHINGIWRWRRKINDLCLYFPHKITRSALKNLRPCSRPPFLKVLSEGLSSGSRNQSSIVYLIGNKVLVPGDAPISEEKKWTKKLPRNLYGLILGHHGSHTSTSMSLLRRTRPKWAVASARKNKYGHPHKKVLTKLKNQKVPVYQTETLGHLYFWIKI